ncbi:hypothetical protein [Kocuria nitroreducens]|uniref:hypothetical protein n=1 Tax=Kocuria nitroreducens TaxID=3058914 RepID=UPI0036D9ED49
MSTWTAEATVRTTRRVDASAVGALSRIISAAHCVARSSGAQGACLRITVEAETRAGAYGTALSLLATQVLPHLEGADLTDLRIVADDPVPARETETVPHRVPMAP